MNNTHADKLDRQGELVPANDPRFGLISIDPNRAAGLPCFAGTHVPLKELWRHLEGGADIDWFLGNFPTVSRQQAVQVLQMASENLLAGLPVIFSEQHHYTPEEYLAMEREAEFRHEYFRGRVYERHSCGPEHCLINTNIMCLIHNQVRDRPFQGMGSTMRVRSGSGQLYAYTDFLIVHGEAICLDANDDTLINPMMIFETLSPNTEAFDRGEKFAEYRTIETLTDYVLISMDAPRIEHYSKKPAGDWTLNKATGIAAKIHFSSIDCTLRLADVYDGATLSWQSQV